jgi:hypothetical protein
LHFSTHLRCGDGGFFIVNFMHGGSGKMSKEFRHQEKHDLKQKRSAKPFQIGRGSRYRLLKSDTGNKGTAAN